MGPHHRSQRVPEFCLLHHGLQGVCSTFSCLCSLAYDWPARCSCCGSISTWMRCSMGIWSLPWEAQVIFLATSTYYFWGTWSIFPPLFLVILISPCFFMCLASPIYPFFLRCLYLPSSNLDWEPSNSASPWRFPYQLSCSRELPLLPFTSTFIVRNFLCFECITLLCFQKWEFRKKVVSKISLKRWQSIWLLQFYFSVFFLFKWFWPCLLH